MPKDTLRVDWKSDKYRDMQYNAGRITPVMVKCLRSFVLGNRQGFQSRTIKALQWRDLVDASQQLTDHGKALALMGVSLRQQCHILNLPLEEWKVSSRGHPEDQVINILEKSGCQAHFVENSFGLFIDFIMGMALIDAGAQLNRPIYTLNPPYDQELYFFVKRGLDEYLSNLTIDHCEKSLPVCSPYLSRLITDETPNQIFTRFNQIYRALGLEKVKSLLRMYFTNPLAYNYRGWPDLFVADPEGSYCIEVKTTDKLNLNQLITIPDLVNLAGIHVKVAQLIL